MQLIEPFSEGRFYHIYNRGVNGEILFREEANYHKFLQLYSKHTFGILDTLAFSLQKDQFQMAVYVNENVFFDKQDGNGKLRLNASRQIGHCFNAYAQSFNFLYQRTGGLFESPFNRIPIDNEDYLKWLICHIHATANNNLLLLHSNSRSYTSYHQLLTNAKTFLNRQMVMRLFGGIDGFRKHHKKDWKLH